MTGFVLNTWRLVSLDLERDIDVIRFKFQRKMIKNNTRNTIIQKNLIQCKKKKNAQKHVLQN